MKRRSSYKPTLFDRHGPEAALQVKAFAYGLMVFGIVVGATFLASASAGAAPPIVLTLLAGVTLGAVTVLVTLRLSGVAGGAARYFTEGGSSTPYEEQFSQEQALVMKRDYEAALALYEQRIAQAPGEPRVRIAAADLYATYGQNPKRAAELYRDVQRIPDVMSGHDIYVSNKLADLYLGPLGEPRRALVEFRRLMERYPGSAAANHARMALTNIKSQLND